MAKVYTAHSGHWDDGRVYVIEGASIRELRTRLDLRKHSPSGFAWGYGGSGPAQLSLAILADLAGDGIALEFYQQYKFEVIAKLDQKKGFVIKEEDVRRVLRRFTDAVYN